MSLKAFGQLFTPPVHKGTVSRWERFGVPETRLIEIETVSGIPRYMLKPELFGINYQPDNIEEISNSQH